LVLDVYLGYEGFGLTFNRQEDYMQKFKYEISDPGTLLFLTKIAKKDKENYTKIKEEILNQK